MTLGTTIFNQLKKQQIDSLKNNEEVKSMSSFNFDDIIELETLGEGGFGRVFKAYHKRKCQYVAIKEFFKSSKASPNDTFNKIILEHSLLKGIKKIAKDNPESDSFLVYDGIFKSPKHPMPVLQMESGFCTLSDVLKAGMKYSAPEALYVTKGLVKGYSLLQKNGICNRDVKTLNIILVEENSEKISYKISDFGIGCIMEREVRNIPFTSIGGITREYAAPEILEFFEQEDDMKKTYNPYKADVFSLGFTVLKMLRNSLKREDFDWLGVHYLDYCEELKNEDEIKKILSLMLNPDPSTRPDFLELNALFQNLTTRLKPPLEEKKYFEISLEIKEKKLKTENDGIISLFNENKALYISYLRKVSRLTTAKRHLDKCCDLLKEFHLTQKGFDAEYNEIWCLSEYGFYYHKTGNYQEAEKNLNECIEKIKRFPEFGEFGIQRLFGGNEGKSRFGEGKKVGMRISEKKRRNLKIMSDVLLFYGNFYKDNAKLNKAEEFNLKSYELRVFLYGKKHGDTNIAINNLGLLYQNMGNLKKAKKYYIKSLKTFKFLYGKNHCDIATSYNNLGNLYENKQKFKKAGEFYEESLRIKVFLYGEKHVNVASSYNNLGSLNKLMRNYQESEDFFMKSMGIYELLYGEKHGDTAISYNNLGSLYYEMRFFEKAEKFLRKSLEIRLFLYGEKHADTASSFNNLGQLYRKTHDLKKAEEFLTKALDIVKGLFGEENPTVRAYRENLKSFKMQK